MQGSLPSYLIKRYLRFDKSQPFITITAILSFLGVGIGVMVLIVSMAIMQGTAKSFEERLFVMNYPLTIYPKYGYDLDENLLNDLKNNFPSLLFSPYISTQVIFKNSNELHAGMLFGVDFKDEAKINSILKEAINGKEMKKYDIILGRDLKEKLFLKEGKKVVAIFTKSSPSGFSLIPTMKRFNLKGSFKSGLNAYDSTFSYTSINSLAKVLGYSKGIYDGIHIYSSEPFKDIEKLKKFLPANIGVVGWWQQNGHFFSALAMEKRALFIVLMLIILMASLNIISSLLMTIMSRQKEIALLLSLGAYPKEIKKSFFLLGFIIGGSGIVFGVILGLLGIFILGNFDIISLPADVYGSSKLPLDLSLIDFFSILFGSTAIVALSSYYPAYKATKTDLLMALRYE
jgi:putative ABC transport system permease protein